MAGRLRALTWWRVALVAVALVVLVLPGRLLASEHASDDALVPSGAGTATGARAVPGVTWHADAGVAASVGDRIEVVEVRPRVSVDTADADITVRLCRDTSRGAAAADPDQGCTPLAGVPARPVDLRPGAARLVVSVTPRRAGTVLIEGYDVTYVDRGHRGTEHAGRPLRLHVP